MNVLFSVTAWKQYTLWQKENKKITQKINDLIKSIQRDPYDGIGKPEALKLDLSGYYSRRITKEHRLVYRIINEKDSDRVEIMACRSHYK